MSPTAKAAATRLRVPTSTASSDVGAAKRMPRGDAPGALPENLCVALKRLLDQSVGESLDGRGPPFSHAFAAPGGEAHERTPGVMMPVS